MKICEFSTNDYNREYNFTDFCIHLNNKICNIIFVFPVSENLDIMKSISYDLIQTIQESLTVFIIDNFMK